MSAIIELAANSKRSVYAYSNQTVWLTSRLLIDWLAQEQVLEDCFSPKKGHVELMRRSTDLFKLLCAEKLLAFEHLDLIWNAMEVCRHLVQHIIILHSIACMCSS